MNSCSRYLLLGLFFLGFSFTGVAQQGSSTLPPAPTEVKKPSLMKALLELYKDPVFLDVDRAIEFLEQEVGNEENRTKKIESQIELYTKNSKNLEANMERLSERSGILGLKITDLVKKTKTLEKKRVKLKDFFSNGNASFLEPAALEKKKAEYKLVQQKKEQNLKLLGVSYLADTDKMISLLEETYEEIEDLPFWLKKAKQQIEIGESLYALSKSGKKIGNTAENRALIRAAILASITVSLDVTLNDGRRVVLYASRKNTSADKLEIKIEWDSDIVNEDPSELETKTYLELMGKKSGGEVSQYASYIIKNAKDAADRLLGSIARRHKKVELGYSVR